MEELAEVLKELSAGKDEIIYIPLQELLDLLKCHKVFTLSDLERAFKQVSIENGIGEYAYLKDVLWEMGEK